MRIQVFPASASGSASSTPAKTFRAGVHRAGSFGRRATSQTTAASTTASTTSTAHAGVRIHLSTQNDER